MKNSTSEKPSIQSEVSSVVKSSFGIICVVGYPHNGDRVINEYGLSDNSTGEKRVQNCSPNFKCTQRAVILKLKQITYVQKGLQDGI